MDSPVNGARQAPLLDLPDAQFMHVWSELGIDGRGGLPPAIRADGLARYNQLMGTNRLSVVPIFDRPEPGVPTRPQAATSERLTGWPAPLDLEALADREPEPPKFIVPNWGPAGYAWLLAGHGGAGKSHIAATLAVCIAAGVPFLGLPVERRRVVLLSCEDREDVLHWRLTRIAAHVGVDLGSLRGWLVVLDLVGQDTILWTPDRGDGKVLTAAYGTLQALVSEHQAEVLIIDGISDTYAGKENDRGEPKRYVNALLGLIPPDRGAVVLVGHVNKATAAREIATSEGYSGSTAWHNAVRARWYLYPEARDGDDGERTGDLLLELQKSNLGRAEQSIRLAWDERAHVLAGRIDGTGNANLDRTTRELEEQAGILAALRECHARAHVPAATSGRRTAYNVLSASPSFPETLRGRLAVRRFWKLLEGLRLRGEVIDDIHRGADRHRTAVLVPAGNAGIAK